MKYFYKFTYILTLLFFFNAQAYSNEKIAFVDLDFLINNTNIGKTTLKKINDLDKKNINFLKKKNNELKDYEDEIKKKQNIISEESFDKEVKLFKKKIREFNDEKVDMTNKFNKYKKEELDNLFKKISPIIKDYMDKNSVSILLDTKNVFMGKSISDLTRVLLEEINTKIN